MTEAIQRLSDELARDPSSLVFLELGESLRRSGQLDLAMRVAQRGLERHPHLADAHDLLARICVDRGALTEAFDEWGVVLRLVPDHVGAHKGLGYVLYKQSRLDEAEAHLSAAAAGDEGDAAIATALRMVRRLRRYAEEASSSAAATGGAAALAAARGRVEAETRTLFAAALGDGEHTALLLDGAGLPTAGAYPTATGEDAAGEVAAALAGIREEADRAAQHAGLGAWRSLVCEGPVATLALAPAAEGGLVVLAAAPAMPVGYVMRVLERCVARANDWLLGVSHE